ncbi:MAG: hypothetical protein Q7T33_08780 [Dehalococcoidia bacterium]|nr:hypothetical protein [Dehalococcoidia bacterium]
MKLRQREVLTAKQLARARPAFYALRSGGWRDYVTLLHPPYTLWHLSYVVLGAALSPTVRYDRLGATLVAFALALGVGAHALDELAGRPLRTGIPRPVLGALAAAGLGGAVALGVVGAIAVSPWLLGFIAFGAFIAPAYNLEWFRGRFHHDFWFALAWGAFPFLTAYWVSSERFEASALFGAGAVFALSLAQRVLSRRVRSVRRRVRSIEGRLLYDDGTAEDIDRRWALAADERALMLMAVAVAALSAAALVARL